ncbi:MAG: hypothetical protein HC771_13870 [Synechococcales cyanobacterium CRU_2_2]|nr:hypothetical protein [Synechococcales cyanobacterium CRU_2_2]
MKTQAEFEAEIAQFRAETVQMAEAWKQKPKRRELSWQAVAVTSIGLNLVLLTILTYSFLSTMLSP